MNEPTDPEKQLRDILKDRDAGAVDLLDAWKEELLGGSMEHNDRMKNRLDEANAQRERAELARDKWRQNHEKAERHLSVLRELAESAAEGDTGALELLVEEARKTAHDAAPAAPTLTLEDVDGAMRKGGVDPATARSVRGILEAKIRVAQKGAGRGDGK